MIVDLIVESDEAHSFLGSVFSVNGLEILVIITLNSPSLQMSSHILAHPRENLALEQIMLNQTTLWLHEFVEQDVNSIIPQIITKILTMMMMLMKQVMWKKILTRRSRFRTRRIVAMKTTRTRGGTKRRYCSSCR
jgi:hypothetical protein